MVLRSEAVIDRSPTEHAHSDKERCPLCDQVLPHDLSVEDLQTRLLDREREVAGAAEKRLRVQFEADQAAREKVIRAEAKSLAETALQGEIARAKEEKAKAVQEKDSAVEASNKLKAEQEERTNRAIQEALRQQREALEKESTTTVQQIQAQEFEKTQKIQKQLAGR